MEAAWRVGHTAASGLLLSGRVGIDTAWELHLPVLGVFRKSHLLPAKVKWGWAPGKCRGVKQLDNPGKRTAGF